MCIFSPFFLPIGELLPPSFNLWATSSTLTVYIQEKPILREIFSFGVSYTIFLEERGQDNKVSTELGLKAQYMKQCKASATLSIQPITKSQNPKLGLIVMFATLSAILKHKHTKT